MRSRSGGKPSGPAEARMRPFSDDVYAGILLELRASKLEHSWINKGGNGYLNPLFRGHGDSGSRA